MNLINRFVLTVTTSAVFIVPVMAQQVPAPAIPPVAVPSAPAAEIKKDEKKYDLKLSGILFTQYYQEISNPQYQNVSEAGNFQVTRAYITLDKQFDDIFSARITADFIEGLNDLKMKNNTDPKADEVNKTASKYSYSGILKNAYLQAKYGIQPVDITFQVGMIGTPIISMIDKQSGYRWISGNYIDGSKNLLGNKSYGSGSDNSLNDNSADLGVSLSVEAIKMITLTYAVTNGEGFKCVVENNKYHGKAQYGVITVSPVRFLYLNGFMRHEFEETKSKWDTTYKDKTCLYGGAGAGIDLMGIKFGGYYAMGTHETSDTRDSKSRLLDFYLNTNMKELAGLPVLVYGRMAWGKDDKVVAVTGKENSAFVWAAGLGYEFNNNVKAGVYYEDYTIDYAVNDHARTFYVKSEIKL